MHWGREEEWRTDLPQKTEGETPTGKAQKLLFPCQKTVKKGKDEGAHKEDRRLNV
jgi:hypothetical protein